MVTDQTRNIVEGEFRDQMQIRIQISPKIDTKSPFNNLKKYFSTFNKFKHFTIANMN